MDDDDKQQIRDRVATQKAESALNDVPVYESMPKHKVNIYDHHQSDGCYGAIQSSRVLLQLKCDEEDKTLSLNEINSGKKYCGLCVCNPTTKNLNMVNVYKNYHSLKGIPVKMDRIFRSLDLDVFWKIV